MTHNATSGVAHFIAADDTECLAMIRELMSFLPLNNLDDPPRRATSDPITRADVALANELGLPRSAKRLARLVASGTRSSAGRDRQ